MLAPSLFCVIAINSGNTFVDLVRRDDLGTVTALRRMHPSRYLSQH
jgi:hypothetical protein